MQNRRDQLQAHLFVVGRLVSGLVRGEPDAPETPMRRSTTSTFAGVMVAVIAVAGFAVFGLIRPGGSKAFREPGTIIVEKETGSRFMLIDGLLRPVLNAASAKLLAGSSGQVRSVSARSLAGIAHGSPVGIPGAPDALPGPANQSFGPWLICSPQGTDATGVKRPVVTLAVGSNTAVSGLPTDQGVLVTNPDGTAYLAWQNTRLRINSRAALLALGYGTAQAAPVALGWLNALPAGPDLQAQQVPGRGGSGPPVMGLSTRVGQVLAVSGTDGKQDFFLVRQDGIAPLTRTDAALLLGDPGSAIAYPDGVVKPIPITAAALAAAPRSSTDAVTPGFPPEPPQLVNPSAEQRKVPCVREVFRSAAGPDLQVAFVDPAQVGATGVVAVGPGRDARAADRVTVPPGGGLLVQAVPEPNVNTGALFLVNDLGVKYPLPTPDVAGALGYDVSTAVPVPAITLSFLPTGPVLDPEAAKQSQPAVPVGSAG